VGQVAHSKRWLNHRWPLIALAALLGIGIGIGVHLADDSGNPPCASDDYIRHDVTYRRDANQGCQFVATSGEIVVRRCFDWQKAAPSLAEVERGCGEPGDFLVEFDVQPCEDGRTVYSSPIVGWGYLGEPKRAFASKDELDRSLAQAVADCRAE